MLLVGQIIHNRYRILEPLGRGGMGSVYKAQDETLNRTVAIKELRIDPGTSPQIRAQIQQQFLQEAQVLANMHHSNLPRVTDYFTVEASEYLVMDFIEGRSLGVMLAQSPGQPFDEAQVLGWARQVLDAVAYCHGRGVIHRDVKPQNLIVTPDGRVVLVDFGLAKLYGPDQELVTKSALRGLGTPEYAPPEQYDMSSGHTDPRSDIYAAGATLYHLLTGQPPPTATQRVENPASFMLPPTWHALVSPTTQAVVLKALRIPRAERFSSVGEMQAALFPGGVGAYGAPYSAAYPASGGGAAAAPPASGGVTPAPGGQGATPAPADLPATPAWATAGMIALAGVMFLVITFGTLSAAGRALGAMLGGPDPTAPAAATSAAGTVAAATALAGGPTVGGPTVGGPTVGGPTAGAAPSATGAPPGTGAPATARPSPGRPSATPVAPVGATDTPGVAVATPYRRPTDGAVMVFVPGGSFVMGADDADTQALDIEKPAHVVFLDSFWIDRLEVSNEQFARFVLASGYRTDAESRGAATIFYRGAWREVRGVSWRQPYGPGTTLESLLDHPVVAVSWNDATAYCRWAGARLPTEAEWEKAARGASGQLWPWGTEFDGQSVNFCDKQCPDAWHAETTDDGNALTAPVESYPSGASPYGALNLAGNALEWVADFFDPEYYHESPVRNPTGPERGTRHVLRGGSWYAPPARLRTTVRAYYPPNAAFGNVGFRCASSTPAVP